MNRRLRARIALVTDAPDGPLDGLARALTPVLAGHFDIERLQLSDYAPPRAATATPGTPSELFHELFCGAYDVVHAFTPDFPARVFDPVIAAEPRLRDPGTLVDGLLTIPLTVSLHDHSGWDGVLDWCRVDRERARELLTSICAGCFVTSPLMPQAVASLLSLLDPPAVVHTSLEAITFFETAAGCARATAGPMAETAIWERSKAWTARVERVLAGTGAVA